MKQRKISFLGEFVIIIIIVLFAFLFLNQIKTNEVNKISQINQKYSVTAYGLVPTDPAGYIAEISFLIQTDVTNFLIDFTTLSTEISEIESLLYRASVVREECVSKDLKLKIEAAYLKIEKLKKQASSLNEKRYAKLNISSYEEFLTNSLKKYTTYKIDIEKVAVCKLK